MRTEAPEVRSADTGTAAACSVNSRSVACTKTEPRIEMIVYRLGLSHGTEQLPKAAPAALRTEHPLEYRVYHSLVRYMLPLRASRQTWQEEQDKPIPSRAFLSPYPPSLTECPGMISLFISDLMSSNFCERIENL